MCIRDRLKSTGEMRDKRTIVLGDDTGCSVQATCWGGLACSDDLREGVVMAVKGAKVSDYGGKSLNISEDGCGIEYDPKMQERTHELIKWWDDYKKGGAQMEQIT